MTPTAGRMHVQVDGHFVPLLKSPDQKRATKIIEGGHATLLPLCLE